MPNQIFFAFKYHFANSILVYNTLNIQSIFINIILDNLPPVVTFDPPSVPPFTTNLKPVLLTGTVDDSLTTVTIGSISATMTQRAFSVSVPLPVTGVNSLQLVATGPTPNSYVTTQTLLITLGTVPTIQAAQPSNTAKLYVDTAATVQATSVQNLENDPLEYQFLLDGTVLAAWGAGTSYLWTPQATHAGPYTLTIDVRDDYGGSSTLDTRVFVVPPPIQHP